MGIREDVNLLGRILGWVLKEQEGEAFFDLVERTRALVKSVRDGGDETELRELISGLNKKDATNLARAFTWYFQLVNLAEEHERVRTLSDHTDLRTQGLEAALTELKQAGMTAEEAKALFKRIELELTFTAHPTEMRRRTVRNHLFEVAGDIPNMNDAAIDRIAAHVEALWTTPELRHLKPTVLDEVKGGLHYVSSIAEALPILQRDLNVAFQNVYQEKGVPLPVRFSSWMGGDRDGNPFVTPEATKDTLTLHQERARELLLERIKHTFAALSQELAGQESYRQELEALYNAVQEHQPVELLARIEQLHARLYQDKQYRTADHLLRPLLTHARVFGQHLVGLDIREHSGKTGEAVAFLLASAGVTEDYQSLSEKEKQALLSQELTSRRPLWPAGAAFPEQLETVLGPIREVRKATLQAGPKAFGHYIISMAESVSDVLEPLILSRELGFRVLPVPLFETLDDLQRAPQVVSELLNMPIYRQVLDNDVQEIMLGYSDSNKDAGFLAANWALHEAQRTISAVCREAGIRWRFFHGRGTSIGRGGGPASRAILGQPAGSIDAGLRMTEQGEALADKYSHPLRARHNLEQALYGLTLAAARPAADPPAQWMEAMTRAASASAQAYRSLVQDEAFLPFYEKITPIHELSRLNIASRPVRRPGAPTLANLRAIPWVMSWTQSRANIPGWYGLKEGLDELGLTEAQEMYQKWPFFSTVIDNAQMSLAKSDPLIFSEYLSLLDEDDHPLAKKIQERYLATVQDIEKIVGHKLLDNEAHLKESIQLRNPYIDPIHRIQVELLRRSRNKEHGLDEYEKPLMLTLQGISAGIRTTG